MKRIFLSLIMLCAGALLFAQANRNVRYIAVQSAAVKSSTGFFAKEVGKLALGTEVTIIRENGKWTEVRSGNTAGWVATSSLSARRIVTSNANVSANEIALAGKGFSPGVEAEYRKGGVDYSGVDAMERIVIADDELLQFITDGNLSRGD